MTTEERLNKAKKIIQVVKADFDMGIETGSNIKMNIDAEEIKRIINELLEKKI